jgi:threonine synthase
MNIQHKLAHLEGIYGEAASVTSVAALTQLKDRKQIKMADKIVCLVTSTGLKDPDSTSRHLGPLLSLKSPDLEKLIQQIQAKHGLDLGR